MQGKYNIDTTKFKIFSPDEVDAWGKANFGDWMPELQNQSYSPISPAECFFRYYTQGIHYSLNGIVRFNDIDNYDFTGSLFNKKMFDDSIDEINIHTLKEDIVVYRYIENTLIKPMLFWGGSKFLKKGSILADKGFMSTTLCLDAVQNRHYANLNKRSLFTIYVPKGTPCVYVDLISDMNENEIIFAPGIKLKVLDTHFFKKFVECDVEI